MTDAFAKRYADFVRQRLRPAVASINTRKRSGMIRGLAAGLVVFLAGAGIIYLFLAPYRDIMQSNSLSFWPLLIMAPAALGVLVFTLLFVLSLKKTVGEFQNSLANGMAEFIDPGLVHDASAPIPPETAANSGLLPEGKRTTIGGGRFRGRADGGTAEFADVVVKDGDGRKSPRRAGVFMMTRLTPPAAFPWFVFPGGAEVSISSLEAGLKKDGAVLPGGLVRIEQGGRQYLVPAEHEKDVGRLLPNRVERMLEELHGANGADLALSARNEELYLTLLSPATKGTSLFESLDFDECREFCRSAKAGLEVARAVSGGGNRNAPSVAPQNLS